MSDNTAPYKVGAVANFIIGRARQTGVQLTHIKLQKLVYISYGIYLAITEKKLFVERIEAWPFGPVVPSLYHEFKRFGASPIRKWSRDFDYTTGTFETPLVSDSDETAVVALNCTWSVYGEMPAFDLVKSTHNEGTPWHQARAADQSTIEDSVIKHHYEGLLDAWGAEQD